MAEISGSPKSVLPSSFFWGGGAFCLFRAIPKACGGSQARGPIGAVGAGLHHSHNSAGSELYLQSTPQLIATPEP